MTASWIPALFSFKKLLTANDVFENLDIHKLLLYSYSVLYSRKHCGRKHW